MMKAPININPLSLSERLQASACSVIHYKEAKMKRLFIAVMSLAVAGSASANLVVNGSFEETQTAVYTVEGGVVDGWDYSPGFQTGIMPELEASFAFDVPADDGNQFGYLWVTGNEIAQDINGFVIGETYQIQWSERARPGYTGNLWVLMDGVTVDAAHAVSAGSWVAKSIEFTATAETHRLRFFHNGAWDTMTFVDNVSVAQPPLLTNGNFDTPFTSDHGGNFTGADGTWAYTSQLAHNLPGWSGSTNWGYVRNFTGTGGFDIFGDNIGVTASPQGGGAAGARGSNGQSLDIYQNTGLTVAEGDTVTVDFDINSLSLDYGANAWITVNVQLLGDNYYAESYSYHATSNADGVVQDVWTGRSVEVLVSAAEAGNTIQVHVQAAGVWIDDMELTITPGPEAFAAMPDPVMPNLIPNGSFDQVDSQIPAVGGVQVWNINGSYGDFLDFENRTANVTGWAPYKEDPNLLAGKVGVEHLVTGDSGDLNGTYYLDTLWTDGEAIVMNSALSYGNGMVQEDILSVVTIDPASTYKFSVDLASGGDTSLSTFTAALTSGVDATNTATAVDNGLILIDGGSYPVGDGSFDTLVNGDDLSGQVNVLFKHMNASENGTYPVIGPGDNNIASLNVQVAIFDVSLTEVFAAEAGDVNKDGVVDLLDVELAQLYLDGNGGDSAADRQSAVLAVLDWYTPAETLSYLNLTDFDMDGDDYFGAADVAALEALIPALALEIIANGGTIDVQWQSRTGAKLYDLESTTDLGGAWAPYNDGETTHENLSGEVGTVLSVPDVQSGDVRFFKVVEK
jgi:hypothetical protein